MHSPTLTNRFVISRNSASTGCGYAGDKAITQRRRRGFLWPLPPGSTMVAPSSPESSVMSRLSLSALSTLPGHVGRPAYDRTTITPGIVHLGIGAFHRAHMAVYVDNVL